MIELQLYALADGMELEPAFIRAMLRWPTHQHLHTAWETAMRGEEFADIPNERVLHSYQGPFVLEWQQRLQVLQEATQATDDPLEKAAFTLWRHLDTFFDDLDPEQTLAEAEAVLALSPHFPQALLYHANALRLLGKKQEAAAAFMRAKEAMPHYRFVDFNARLLAIIAKEEKASSAELLALGQQYPHNADLAVDLIAALLRENKPVDALVAAYVYDWDEQAPPAHFKRVFHSLLQKPVVKSMAQATFRLDSPLQWIADVCLYVLWAVLAVGIFDICFGYRTLLYHPFLLLIPCVAFISWHTLGLSMLLLAGEGYWDRLTARQHVAAWLTGIGLLASVILCFFGIARVDSGILAGLGLSLGLMLAPTVYGFLLLRSPSSFRRVWIGLMWFCWIAGVVSIRAGAPTAEILMCCWANAFLASGYMLVFSRRSYRLLYREDSNAA